ncbi:band 7-like protein [Agrobacterium phage OLIVR2]|uniref:Band 7-like protein n=1 Tax=Agrobacterium phage OLIVR1 TaxID=2723769 RepID=A0A858MXH3_9CAUD|nr:band 7-like protein [Agrobacterium phage OLIVR1]QIW87245.1 band 7-like protein [Agrobacterium phage OLIVR1]QIW87353.1 band 7-like protein [Agrobacterium phage OLIVR2]QIW87460.1 band 7-like protein [Agrobacterium phage OLIVR3]
MKPGSSNAGDGTVTEDDCLFTFIDRIERSADDAKGDYSDNTCKQQADD